MLENAGLIAAGGDEHTPGSPAGADLTITARRQVLEGESMGAQLVFEFGMRYPERPIS